jgi:hypothetical protein
VGVRVKITGIPLAVCIFNHNHTSSSLQENCKTGSGANELEGEAPAEPEFPVMQLCSSLALPNI